MTNETKLWKFGESEHLESPLRVSVSDKYGVPAVGGLKFSMPQKKVQKSASWGTGASWGTKINPWTDDFFPIL